MRSCEATVAADEDSELIDVKLVNCAEDIFKIPMIELRVAQICFDLSKSLSG
jgi:hypothetical protein